MSYSVEPRYGANYGPAFVGFSTRDNNVFSKGIQYFTRHEADQLTPSHSFLVLNQDTLLEASVEGVVKTLLVDYFSNPHIMVYFKKPRGLDEAKTNLILERALSHLGAGYDFGLMFYYIIAYVLRQTDPGMRLRWNLWIQERLPGWLDNPNRELCSELVADALNQIVEWRQLPPLSDHTASAISPVDLFYSPIFEEWQFRTSDLLIPTM